MIWPAERAEEKIQALHEEVVTLKNKLQRINELHYSTLCDGCADGLDIIEDSKYPGIPMHKWQTQYGPVVGSCRAYKLRALK